MLTPTFSTDPLAQNPFEAEWVLMLRPSRWLNLFLMLLHSLAALTICLMPIMLWFKVAIGLLIATSASYYWAKYNGYWPSRSIQALKWREFGGWELYSADGKRHAVKLLDNSYTSALVTILNFKTLPGRRFSVILTPDLLPLAQARHLKRRLLLLH